MKMQFRCQMSKLLPTPKTSLWTNLIHSKLMTRSMCRMSKMLLIIMCKVVPTIQTETGVMRTRKTKSGVEVPAKEMMKTTILGPALDSQENTKILVTPIPKLTLRSISRSSLGRLATKTSMNNSPDSVQLKR